MYRNFKWISLLPIGKAHTYLHLSPSAALLYSVICQFSHLFYTLVQSCMMMTNHQKILPTKFWCVCVMSGQFLARSFICNITQVVPFILSFCNHHCLLHLSWVSASSRDKYLLSCRLTNTSHSISPKNFLLSPKTCHLCIVSTQAD